LQQIHQKVCEWASSVQHQIGQPGIHCWWTTPLDCKQTDLLKSATSPQAGGSDSPYWDYLHQWFTWTHSDLRSIQWDTFKITLKSFLRNNQWCLILFIHNKLAFQTSKFHPHLGSQLCPSCQRNPEDIWHFFDCQKTYGISLTAKTQTEDVSFWTYDKPITVKHSLHPAILTTFWLGLLTVCNDTPYPDVQDDLPIVLHSTLTAQNCIGWDQLYQGQVTHLWEKVVGQLNPHLKVSGHSIVIQMVKAIWQYILVTWTMCNQHLHQDTRRLSQPNYHQAVRTLYELRPQLPPAQREALFQCPLD